MLTALLTLADSRMPTGGHVHSGGVEDAVHHGLLTDIDSLRAFLLRRVRTSGLVAAGLAATACAGGDPGQLDAEADARTPSPAQRVASRAQGRGLLRLARTTWPSGDWSSLGARPHQAVALGVVAAAAGLTPHDAALAAVYVTMTGSATAAQRLLAMDPGQVAACTLQLAGECDGVAAQAVADGLPCASDPLLDLLAERHALRGGTLFAS
jgi:urease accessory protein